MPDAKADFGTPFWDMHRNSLLLSSLLLLLSLPGVAIDKDQTLMWLKFSGLALNGVRIIIAAGALYAFLAMVSEWWAGPLSYVREEFGLAKTACDDAELALRNFANGSFSFLTAFKAAEESFERNFEEKRKILRGEEVNRLEKARILVKEEMQEEDIFSRLQAVDEEVRKRGAVYAERNKEIIGFTRDVVNYVPLQIASRVLDKLEIDREESYKNSSAEIKTRIEFLNSYLIEQFPLLAKRHSKLINVITRHKIWVAYRGIFIGIFVPSILFITAAAHLVGGLTGRGFTSWFAYLPHQ